MKFILMAFVTAGFIGSSTLALADSPVSAEEAAKIKAAIEVLGCTGGKMEKRPRVAVTSRSMTRSAEMGSTTSSSIRISR